MSHIFVLDGGRRVGAGNGGGPGVWGGERRGKGGRGRCAGGVVVGKGEVGGETGPGLGVGEGVDGGEGVCGEGGRGRGRGIGLAGVRGVAKRGQGGAAGRIVDGEDGGQVDLGVRVGLGSLGLGTVCGREGTLVGTRLVRAVGVGGRGGRGGHAAGLVVEVRLNAGLTMSGRDHKEKERTDMTFGARSGGRKWFLLSLLGQVS